MFPYFTRAIAPFYWKSRCAGLAFALAWAIAGASPALAAPSPAPRSGTENRPATHADNAADAPFATAHPELLTELPDAARVGSIKFRFWGFDVYRATLWAGSGFRAGSYATTPFALDLVYLRGLDGAAIAQRSLDEMKRQSSLTPAQADAWLSAMTRLFPNVKNGDRITGVNRPGTGAAFWVNGQPAGEIKDPEFARLFFGIWLAPATSQPAMRQALLEKARP
jgi:hypothetical protein